MLLNLHFSFSFSNLSGCNRFSFIVISIVEAHFSYTVIAKSKYCLLKGGFSFSPLK